MFYGVLIGSPSLKFKIIKERPLKHIDEVGVIKDAEIKPSYNCPTTHTLQTVITRREAHIDAKNSNKFPFFTNILMSRH